jgi:hypothetical protein
LTLPTEVKTSPKHSSNKSIPPHASGLKVSCRRSHHHLSRPALWIDCGSTGTQTALEIDASSLLVAVLYCCRRGLQQQHTVHSLLPALAPPTRLFSNHERCITQAVSSPPACHSLTCHCPFSRGQARHASAWFYAPPSPEARPLTSVLPGLSLGICPGTSLPSMYLALKLTHSPIYPYYA